MACGGYEPKGEVYEDGFRQGFCRYINKKLLRDPDCRDYMPLDPFNDALYNSVKEGVIPCKLLNVLFPNAIDERSINKSNNVFYPSHREENIQLALSAARCNGCAIQSISVDDLMGVKPYFKLACLEFFRNVIVRGFFRQINLHEHPELLTLKTSSEDLHDIMCLSPEEILTRYVNFHLTSSGITKVLNSFEYDLSDGVVYAYLLHKIAPITIRSRLLPPDQVLVDSSIANRAKAVLQNLRELGADMFLCEDDFINAYEHRRTRGVLHMITISYLLLHFAGELKSYGGGDQAPIIERPTELACRNFVNSVDVRPFSTHICSNLRDGLISSQLFEILRPGSTTGIKFTREFDRVRRDAQFLQNNTCIVRLVQGYPFRLPSLDAERLMRSDSSICLSLLVEMIRNYLSFDAYDEYELLRWTNEQLYRAGKTKQLRSFSDKIIAEENLFAVILNNLTNGMAKKECLLGKRIENARYYISIAHKAGYKVYTRPEHFETCTPVWVALAFAALRWDRNLS